MIYYIKPWIYPIILSVEMICTVMITYFKSTNDGHAVKDFPYISDTGNKGVSASLFSLLFSIYGFLVFINMTIRFEQVKETYNYKDDRFIFLANIGTLSVGLVACLGVFLASNFQIDTLKSVHDSGAVMAFGIGTFYFGMQSIFSFFMTKLPGSNTITNVIRVIMSVLQTAFLVSTYVMMRQYSNSKDLADKRIAAILEWIMALLVTIYWCTFIQEFYQYNWKIQLERIKNKENRVDISH